MNKTELIAAVAEKTGMSKKDTEAVISATRTGRNPRSKETIQIPASQTPVFKAGKALKDAVAK